MPLRNLIEVLRLPPAEQEEAIAELIGIIATAPERERNAMLALLARIQELAAQRAVRH
jgi:hypothetical protein